MTAPQDPDRPLRRVPRGGPDPAPGSVFDAVRDRWKRNDNGSSSARGGARHDKFVPYALGAAAVVVALVVGIQFLRPADAGRPPSRRSSRGHALATPSTALSASPAASIPPLTQTFTSPLHGFSVSTQGWLAERRPSPGRMARPAVRPTLR